MSKSCSSRRDVAAGSPCLEPRTQRGFVLLVQVAKEFGLHERLARRPSEAAGGHQIVLRHRRDEGSQALVRALRVGQDSAGRAIAVLLPNPGVDLIPVADLILGTQ